MGWGWIVTLIGGGVGLLIYLAWRFPNAMGAIGDLGSSIADIAGDFGSSDGGGDSGGC